jgi:acetyl esterase/lipase
LFLLLFLGFGVILPLSGCSPFDVLNTLNTQSDIAVQRNIPYRQASERGSLDVYTPAAPLPGHPVVVFIYGGAWQGGTKQQYEFMGEALAARGLTVVVPDYGIYPPAIFPSFVEDAAAAVAWTKAHIADYGGNPDALFVAGHSAGAHIAALIALDPEYLAPYHMKPADLAGMIGIAGPYNFLPITRADLKPIFSVPDLAATQPITYADGKNPPILLQAGEDDTTVDPQKNTVGLDLAIEAHGGKVDMKLYPGLSHIGIILTFVSVIGGDEQVPTDFMAFIAAHTPKAPTP